MARCLIASSSGNASSLIASAQQRRTSLAGHRNAPAAARSTPATRSPVATRAASDGDEPPSMFRRLALALGVASAAAGGGAAQVARAAEPIPADLPQTEEEWKARLSPESFYVLRREGTERPFTSPLNKEKRKGTFVCAGCGTRLFSSSAKFDSGTGWPSFFAPLTTDGTSVEEKPDNSLFMRRVEVHCAKCKGHLGHVFPDGPRPTGLRYCMNGVSLEFVPDA